WSRTHPRCSCVRRQGAVRVVDLAEDVLRRLRRLVGWGGHGPADDPAYDLEAGHVVAGGRVQRGRRGDLAPRAEGDVPRGRVAVVADGQYRQELGPGEL